MIDWARLYELRSEIGTDNFNEVVVLFLEEADAAVDRLVGHNDSQTVLHFLKGSALNLGFADLAALCQDGERRAAAGATPDVGATVRCYQTSRAAFLAGLGAEDTV